MITIVMGRGSSVAGKHCVMKTNAQMGIIAERHRLGIIRLSWVWLAGVLGLRRRRADDGMGGGDCAAYLDLLLKALGIFT